jgi:hypothetical protein
MLRVLILSLLIPACVWPVAAQSSSDKIPLASWLPVSQSDPQLEFRQRASALSQNSHTKQTNPSQFPVQWGGLNVSPATPGAVQSVNPTSFSLPKFVNQFVTLAQNAAPCYSIRSYRFTRDDPRSDSTRFTAYSTCQPATQFHVKDAVNVHR